MTEPGQKESGEDSGKRLTWSKLPSATCRRCEDPQGGVRGWVRLLHLKPSGAVCFHAATESCPAHLGSTVAEPVPAGSVCTSSTGGRPPGDEMTLGPRCQQEELGLIQPCPGARRKPPASRPTLRGKRRERAQRRDSLGHQDTSLQERPSPSPPALSV